MAAARSGFPYLPVLRNGLNASHETSLTFHLMRAGRRPRRARQEDDKFRMLHTTVTAKGLSLMMDKLELSSNYPREPIKCYRI